MPPRGAAHQLPRLLPKSTRPHSAYLGRVMNASPKAGKHGMRDLKLSCGVVRYDAVYGVTGLSWLGALPGSYRTARRVRRLRRHMDGPEDAEVPISYLMEMLDEFRMPFGVIDVEIHAKHPEPDGEHLRGVCA
jgi:hypothetical protein